MNMANEICVARNPVDGNFYAMNLEQGGTFKEAQLVTPEDISAIEAVVVLDEVLGLVTAEQRLRQLCGVVRMPELVMTVDVGTLRTGTEKVPAMVEAELKADAYVPTSFELWKNVDHIAFSDEAVKKARHDIVQLHTQKTARVLGAMENSQISTVLTDLTDQTGADWGAKSGGVSDNNPFDDIGAAIATIMGTGCEPNKIAMGPLAWADFIGNTHVQKSVTAGMVKVGESIALPMFPTMQLVIDSALTDTVCYVIDQRAPCVMLGDGPVEAERYRHAPAGFTGYIVRQWIQPKMVLADAGIEITGVHA